jgi:integrase
VRPARETDVHAAAAAAPAAIATMIQVQWWTGMRPGEVVIMRAADIELLDDIWIFRPIEHKTQHHDQARVIPLGPRARSLLAPHMRKPEEAFLFPGVQREQWLFTHRRAKRYTTATYRQAVLRACARAGVARWTPLQLRHAAGTRLRQLMGLETARTVLGHAHASTTEIYAERDQQRAIDAMKLLG